MRMFAVKLSLLIIVGCAKVVELAPFRSDSQCLQNPSMCLNQLNQVMRQLQSFAQIGNKPRQQQQQQQQPQSQYGFSRKLGTNMMQDEMITQMDDDPIFKQQTAVPDEEQIRNLMYWFKDKILTQKQREAEDAKEKQAKLRQKALEDLVNVLHRFAVIKNKIKSSGNKNQDTSEHIEEPFEGEIADALQQLATAFNIKSNKVNTNQDIKEFNNELVDALMKALTEVSSDDINSDEIANKLRRIAMKNAINGVKVNTKQDIKEYNDEVGKELSETVRRMAVRNNIKGSNVNTYQKLAEYNNFLRVLNEALQQLTVTNNIEGDVVNTKQKVEEYNDNDNHSANHNPNDGITKALDDAIRRLAMLNNIKGEEVDTKQDIKEINNDVEDNQAKTRPFAKEQNVKVPAVEEVVRRLALKNNIKGELVNTKQDIKEHNAMDDHNDQIEKKQDPSQINNEALDKAVEEVIRRLAIENNIKGELVNTEQDIKEHNNMQDQNDIHGENKGQKQASNPNAEVTKAIQEIIRRLAIKNNIEGEVVNTDQKVEEFNYSIPKNVEQALKMLAVDDVKGDIVDAKREKDMENELNDEGGVRRLSVDNNIQGHTVNTEQDVQEFNNVDRSDSMKIFHSKNRMGGGGFSQEMSGMKIAPGQLIIESRQVDDPKTLSDDDSLSRKIELNSDAFFDEEDEDEEDDDEDDDEDDEYEEDKEKSSDVVEEIGSTRRMVVNNNAGASRRMTVENNVEGETVQTEQKVAEVNSRKQKPIQAKSPPRHTPSTKLARPIAPCRPKVAKKVSDDNLAHFLEKLNLFAMTQ